MSVVFVEVLEIFCRNLLLGGFSLQIKWRKIKIEQKIFMDFREPIENFCLSEIVASSTNNLMNYMRKKNQSLSIQSSIAITTVMPLLIYLK